MAGENEDMGVSADADRATRASTEPAGSLGHSAGIPNATILALWDHTKGRAWEPRGGTNSPLARRLIAAGYLEVCDMRCGFEALKDAGLRWTDAGKNAAQGMPPTGRDGLTGSGASAPASPVPQGMRP